MDSEGIPPPPPFHPTSSTAAHINVLAFSPFSLSFFLFSSSNTGKGLLKFLSVNVNQSKFGDTLFLGLIKINPVA